MTRIFSLDTLECVALVLGGTMAAFLVDGFITAITILKPLLTREGFATAFQLDWILSLMVGGCFLASPLVELLVAKIGYRTCFISGGYLCALSIVITSFAANYWMMLITLGVFGTLSFALQMITSIICVSNNFEKRRPTAIGIITCGTGLGITAYSIFTPYLLMENHWRSVLMIIACINFQVVVFGLFMKPRKNMSPEEAKTNFFSQLEMGTDTTAQRNTLATIIKSSIRMPTNLIGSGLMSTCSMEKFDLRHATVTDLLKLDHNLDAPLDLNQMMGAIGSVIYLNKIEDYIPNVMRHEKGELARLLKNFIFVMAAISSLLYCLAIQTPTTYLVQMMLDKGYTETDIGEVFVVYGIFNSFCRVSVGLFAATKYCNVIYLITFTSLFSALTIIACPFMTQTYQYYLFAIGFGLGQASSTVLSPLVVAKAVPMKELNKGLSLQLFMMGLGYLIGMPIAGKILTATSSFLCAYAYAAGLQFLAGILYAVASIKFYTQDDQKRLRKALLHQVKNINIRD